MFNKNIYIYLLDSRFRFFFLIEIIIFEFVVIINMIFIRLIVFISSSFVFFIN